MFALVCYGADQLFGGKGKRKKKLSGPTCLHNILLGGCHRERHSRRPEWQGHDLPMRQRCGDSESTHGKGWGRNRRLLKRIATIQSGNLFPVSIIRHWKNIYLKKKRIRGMDVRTKACSTLKWIYLLAYLSARYSLLEEGGTCRMNDAPFYTWAPRIRERGK